MAFKKGNHSRTEFKKGQIPWNKGKKDIYSKESLNKMITNHIRKPLSEDHRKKIGASNLGKRISDETRQKLSESHKGKKASNETRQKQRLVKLGKKRSPHSEETKKKIGLANSIANFGHKHSEETKRKMSISNTGIKKPMVSLALTGKKRPEEVKRKVSLSLLGHTVSDCTKKKLSEANKGEKSYLWKGGISFESYTINWTETLRRSIRERDHYTCQLGGEIQGNVAFSVHHIDYNKKNCDPKNLITLCRKCHAKTNQNREYWKKFFGEKLNEKK